MGWWWERRWKEGVEEGERRDWNSKTGTHAEVAIQGPNGEGAGREARRGQVGQLLAVGAGAGG